MSKNSGVQGKTVAQLARVNGAAERKAARGIRSAERQLELLDERPGGSRRERTRLGDPTVVEIVKPARSRRRRRSKKL
jgi:hypothetical protein